MYELFSWEHLFDMGLVNFAAAFLALIEVERARPANGQSTSDLLLAPAAIRSVGCSQINTNSKSPASFKILCTVDAGN